MADNIERKFDFVAHAYQPMRGGSSFDLEVTTMDAEFALCPQIVSGDRHLCGNRDRLGYAVQCEVADDLQIILIVADCFAGDAGAFENYFRILVRQKHNFSQLLVDDFLLGISEDAACLFHGGCLRRYLQRGIGQRGWIQSRLASEIVNGHHVIVAFEPQQPPAQCMRYEFTLRGIEPVVTCSLRVNCLIAGNGGSEDEKKGNDESASW